MLGIVGRHVAPPPGAQSPARWGEESVVATLLGDGVQDVSSHTHAVTQRFGSAEEFADLFLTHYGPTHMAARRLGDGAEALRHDLVEHARAHHTGDGPGLVTQWEYRVVTATRRPEDQREERS